jgi:ketosteroid isomerase-like protein
MTGSESKTLRFRRWWIVPTLAVLTTAGVPLAAASSAGDAGAARVQAAAAEDPMITETRKAIEAFVQRWNDNKLEEMVAAHYVDDAVILPPNHEPIRGRDAILAFFKGVRDVVGPFDKGDYIIQATANENDSVSWVGQYTFQGGRLRFTTHELYLRQPDGSMRCAVDMFGYRDPMA